jgi:D-alanine-D-alanine ligase
VNRFVNTHQKPINQSRVLLLLGGTSAERDISLKSGAAIKDALLALGADVVVFDTAQKGINELIQLEIDFAFIALHGRDGEDGVIQAVLKSLNIPYTGSQVASSALAMDKYRSKLIWRTLGLATPEFTTIKNNDDIEQALVNAVQCLEFPLFVKPCHEGSSVGMAKVHHKTALIEAVNQAFEFDTRVLLEQFVSGREFTVTILQDRALPVIELKTPRDFYDYQAKYHSQQTEYICPAKLSAEKTTELQQLALDAFNAIGCSGWGRVDVMMYEDGRLQLLEVNTVPGMTEKSLVPMAAKADGVDFNQLVLCIAKTTGVVV